MVRQYALSAEAYAFFTSLKKNKEQLGSIFDAQPSEISGNIHAVSNTSEPVIGFVCFGSSSSQRIFIKKSQLFVPWVTEQFYPDCVLTVDYKRMKPCCYYALLTDNGDVVNPVDEFINYNKSEYADGVIPVSAIGLPAHAPIRYTATTKECADCTLRGTNKKPSFWK